MALLPSIKGRPTRPSCLKYLVASILVPALIIGIIIAVMLPRAPDAKPTQITIKNIQLNGFESVTVDMDIAMDIVNTNKNMGIGFDTVNVTYAFPPSNEPVGRGTLEGGEIPAGGHVERPLSSTFTAPWSLLGPNFLRDMNRGSSDIVVRGNVRGYSTVLRTKFRLSSDLECVVTYNWNDGTTRHSCKTDKRIRLAYTS